MWGRAGHFAERAARKFAALGKRPVSSVWPHGVVSFTFDDFPRSALVHGGSILERHQARGTYYTAFGLAESANELGEMFDRDDIRSAHLRGHEIACHTYSHRNCAQSEKGLLQAEVRDNAGALAPIVDGKGMTSFSYPFGAVSPQARAVMGRSFSSCRGIQPGINERIPDYAELRANKIYATQFDQAKLRDLIDMNFALGGWLIFYTHDVEDSPSAFGCTQAQLETVVEYAARRMPVLPVRDVVSGLGVTLRMPA